MNVSHTRRVVAAVFGMGLLALAAATSAVAHAPGIILTGLGTATIDGVMTPGEWSSAGSTSVPVALPEGGTTPGTLYVMNDADNLYLAVRFARTVVDPGNSIGFEFDNDHDGMWPENGDDVFVYNPGAGFFDDFRIRCVIGSFPAVCGPQDTLGVAPPGVSFPDGLPAAGTNDGSGAFKNDGAFSVYEVAHPLDSADDAHDFSLKPGDTVGFQLFLRMIAAGAAWPVGFGDTTFPPSFGDIVIAGPTTPAVVDVKPGSDENPFNCDSRGKLPAAVLSTSALDATAIDAASLRLARVTAAQTGLEDADGDGDVDLVGHFSSESVASAIGCAALESSDLVDVEVTGTVAGKAFSGTDTLRIVKS